MIKIRTASSPAPAAPRLTLWQLFCYGGLSLPIAMGGLALVSFIPTFYAADMGLGLSLVGAVFVFGRLFDVITDPIIGYLSDQTKSRFGARRPWMVLAFPLYCGALWMLFVPPENVTLLYLITASSLYFLLYTSLDVPYSAVGLEYSSYVHERSVLATTKGVFQILGAITASTLPLFFMGNMAESLRFTAFIIIGLCFIFLCLFLVGMPRRTSPRAVQSEGFFQLARQGLKNISYRQMIISFTIVQTANALTAGLIVLYITHILKAPEKIGLVMGLLFISSALFLPFWVWLSKKLSKARAWRISILTAGLALSAIIWVDPQSFSAALILSAVLGAAFGCDAIMPTSMLADIVYFDDRKGKKRTGGTYLAFKNAVSKMTFVAPMGLAFPILGAIGFNTDAGAQNSGHAVMLLTFFFAVLPILLRIAAFWSVGKIPDTETLGLSS